MKPLPHLVLTLCALLPAARAATPEPLRPWNEYRTILWLGDSMWKQPDKLPLAWQRLREMGINTAMVHGDADPRPLVEARFPYYVENVVNRGLCLKWNSKVREWDPFITAWSKSGRGEQAFVRDYCLDDPKWRAWAVRQMQGVVRKNAPHQPLAYDIRDELSVTLSANPFDYDFSPPALAKFRDWLKTQYRSLDALNAQWETRFATWDEVRPFSTDQIKNRMAGGTPDDRGFPRGKPDWQVLAQLRFDPPQAARQAGCWNLSPWCDFRTYMDISLASTLDELRRAAHEVDPRTPVGIEGTQMPGAWGGYDLWRLSQVLDWVEPYDIGNAREIFGSFMPGKPILTTVFEKDTPHAMRRLWHLLLAGDKGCIVWWSEDCIDWASADCALTPKAKALAPALAAMTSPLARLFLRAEREYDPVAIHYSHPSVQVNWLLESTVDGSTWQRRFSSYEAEHNRMAARRQAFTKLLQDAGYTPRFLSSAQIEAGALETMRVLVLPDSLALSGTELARIGGFLDESSPARMLLGSARPGVFDEHGRLVAKADFKPLAGLAEPGQGTWFALRHPQGNSQGVCDGDIREELKLRKGVVEELPDTGRKDGSNPLDGMSDRQIGEYNSALTGRILTDHLHFILPPPVEIPRRANVRVHRYRLGTARLLAFERNIVWQMSEDLRQAGGNEALEKPLAFEAKLAAPAHVYDLRAGRYLGHTARIAVDLDPWQPSLFALLPQQLPAAGLLERLAR